MSIELTTEAERQAKFAEDLPNFNGLNLLYIKRSVAALIGQIGRECIFNEYTKHDISHINEMLSNLEWIIPEQTKSIMSHTEWLMIVLAVYLHDLGMLVTADEFRFRNDSRTEFSNFCEASLFSGPNGSDYKARIDKLSNDERDRFLYQEFVRHHHAERIKNWISGQNADHLGIAQAAAAEVRLLLEPLGIQFRRDLGMICESHHLNDLNDTKKYRISQPYGNSEKATVNLQYCAVLLRTSDLLHITSDRTPSVEFRTINPSDPISQQEWAKQRAVTSIRPKPSINEDGVRDDKLPADTIEVHAFFCKEDGFFGLNSYLGYAEDQIKKSYEWISNTAKLKLAKHEFPWKKIDDTNIETAGFMKEAFEFTLDQAKILDLLTGHTLYNDTNVVLRELAQNAIDAIRLQYFPNSPKRLGKIKIAWDSNTRILSIQDNGTGMTQGIINNFLLKVGSSRYQDPDFKKSNPEFNSISRFGIGVLSAFMIADGVEIVTCHPDENEARRLMLRSVHGKYLISLLDKNQGDAALIGPHGTIFRLHVRPSIDMNGIIQTAQHWIVIPDCSVTIEVDNKAPISVGHPTSSDALRSILDDSGFNYIEGKPEDEDGDALIVKIVEKEKDGITLAYALVWNRWFREWSFLTAQYLPKYRESDDESLKLGTCVEGIRVINSTPGFEGFPVIAIANIKGKNAPKTNVARSGLEMTHEREFMLKTIYSLYASHVIEELDELISKRGFSLTWATGETYHLIHPLLRRTRPSAVSMNEKMLLEALGEIPCIPVEAHGKRRAMSPQELIQAPEFWRIDCDLLTSAELLIREVASDATLLELANALKLSKLKLPESPIVCSLNRVGDLMEQAFANKEVDQIIVNPEQRRIDLRWLNKSNPPRWAKINDQHQSFFQYLVRKLERLEGYGGYRARGQAIPNVPIGNVVIKTPSDEVAVSAFGQIYLVPGTEICESAIEAIKNTHRDTSMESTIIAGTILSVIGLQLYLRRPLNDTESVRKLLREVEKTWELSYLPKRIEELFDFQEFALRMTQCQWKVYDNSVWRRRYGE